MKKEDWLRLTMHLPWGLMAAALFVLHPAFGVTAFFGTLSYEAFNDARKKDNSYRDVLGIVWGWFLGGFILLALQVIGVDLAF